MSGEVLHQDSVQLKPLQDKDYLLSQILYAIKTIRKKVASDNINPIAIGVSASGFVNCQKGIFLGPDHGIKGWTNVPLSRILNAETGLPAFVDNDANLMTVAEYRFGAAKGFRNVVFVALRSGIGGGIIIDGKLHRGVNNASGEIGQMIINFSGGLSETGIRGSYEHYASASALVRRYLEEKGPDSLNETTVCARDIFELSYKHDAVALKVVNENASLAGVGLANLISIFSPEMIVLGGGMAQAHDDYINLIRKYTLANLLENSSKGVQIERGLLGANAALIGAAFNSLIRLAGKSI
jgi:glucokinase